MFKEEVPTNCDLIVVGAGATGLAVAVTAAWLGLKVVVLEKTELVGGTSAWSGGILWIPRNFFAIASNPSGDIEEPHTYLRKQAGKYFNEENATAFLTYAPQMLEFFQAHTWVEFFDAGAFPDFHCDIEGSAKAGRAVGSAPFDGKELGAAIKVLRPPLALLAPFGMSIASGKDLKHFLNFSRRWASFVHVAKRILRHFADVLSYGRGMHLVNGNALVARLLKSALGLGVTICLEKDVIALTHDASGVKGVKCRGKSGIESFVVAPRGVVLAAGGFPHDKSRVAELFQHASNGNPHFSAAPTTNTGDGLRLAEKIGGKVNADVFHGGGWAPVSLVPGRQGLPKSFPHLIDRAKPGIIMVRSDGKRFCNEADSYHDVMAKLFALTPKGEMPSAWIIADHRALRRYGLGRVRPFPFPIRHWLRNGYLIKGSTLRKLAEACDLDAHAFENCVMRFNDQATKGIDEEFGRGTQPVNQATGDPDHAPSPCLGSLETAPFYAIKIVPGSLSTFAGLQTNSNAQVLNEKKVPIKGLYAVGNDMSSIGGGEYPAGGFTLGPGMTFAYIAAHHACGVPLEDNLKHLGKRSGEL